MRVCVFCGSNSGDEPAYVHAARETARAIVARGFGVVYGGGRVGLMGELADAALAAGGEVIGVIPRALAEREVAHTGVRDLRVVQTMHERKALMAALSDAYIVLPGGFGTLDEMFEALTWRQLGYHRKPLGLLDVEGYFSALVQFCNTAAAGGFVAPHDRALLLSDTSIESLLNTLIPPR